MNRAERAIIQADKDSAEIARIYNVPRSSIVWAGGKKFIVVVDDKTEPLGKKSVWIEKETVTNWKMTEGSKQA